MNVTNNNKIAKSWMYRGSLRACGLMLMVGCGNQRTGNLNLEIQGVGSQGVLAQSLESFLFPELFSAEQKLSPQANESISLSVIDPDGSTAGVLTITDARLVFKKIKFYLDDGTVPVAQDDDSSDDSLDDSSDDSLDDSPDDSNEVSVRGPFIVNLLTNQVSPSLDGIELPVGNYKKIRLDLHKLESGEVTSTEETVSDLEGLSIKVAGTYTGLTASGAVSQIPFLFTEDMDEEFYLLSSKTGVPVKSGGEITKMLLNFKLEQWVDLRNSETNPDSRKFSDLVLSSGQAVITEESTETGKKLGEIFKENIKESADFGKDSDDDGQLSETESEKD